jgi:FAD/FMN-containing dehydrogenase
MMEHRTANGLKPVNHENLEVFAGKLRGKLILPQNEDYDAARAVWNGMIDRYPAMIAQCADGQDVIQAVRFAREQGLIVSVRGGGHNVAGHATNDGGIVIDLGPMKRVQLNLEGQTVHVQGGATWADVDAVTQQHGFAVPGGVVSETGVAGLTLGGGFGHLRNKYGLSSDNLVGAEVVTADARLLHASLDENADLFWGLRGAGGNFGIVTTFEFRLRPLDPSVYFLAVFHHGSRAKEGLRLFRDYSRNAPDEVSVVAFCTTVPPHLEFYPSKYHGDPALVFVGCYAGDPEEGERVMQPLRALGDPVADFSGVIPYVEAQTFFDEDYPSGELRYYWKSLNLARFDDDVIDRIVGHALKQPSPLNTVDIWYNGGAIRRFPESESAFHGRNVEFVLSPEANWKDAADDEANIAWLRNMLADMEEFSDGSRYLNFPGFNEEGEATMRATFGEKYDKLVGLKTRYDPDNLFRLNQNITPSG